MLSPRVKKYFWDIDASKAKPKSHSKYYISRILELGNEDAFNWLKSVYGVEKIRRSIPLMRLSKKSENYWKLYFNSHE